MPDVSSHVIIDSQESALKAFDSPEHTTDISKTPPVEGHVSTRTGPFTARTLVQKTTLLSSPDHNSYNFIICSPSTNSRTQADLTVEDSYDHCENTKQRVLSQKSQSDTDRHFSVRRNSKDLTIGDSQSLSFDKESWSFAGQDSRHQQAKLELNSPSINLLNKPPAVKVQSWLSDDHSDQMAEITDSMQSYIPAPPDTNSVDTKRVSPVGPQNKEISRQILLHQAEMRASISAVGSAFEAPEYLIPTRLNTLQRQIYSSLLLDHADDIVAFCQDPQHDNRSGLEDLLQSLNNVTVHPLLLAASLPESQLSPHDEAWYLIQSSSKFELVAEVIESLRCEPLRIGIFYNDQKSLNLWQTVLDGLQIRHKHFEAENLTETLKHDELEVLTIPVGQEVSLNVHIDLTFSLDKASRLHHAPSIRFVAHNSAEHVMQQVSDLVTVISTVASLSDTVGIFPSDTGDVPYRIVQFLCGHGLEPGLLQEVVSSSSQYDQVSYTASTEDVTLMKHSKQAEHSTSDHVPQIIVTEIDGLEVHTEAPVDPNYPSAPVNGDSETKEISTFHNEFASHFSGLDDDRVPAGNQENPQAQFISPVHLEKNPTQIYEEVKNEIWSKPSVEQQRISTLEEDIERMMNRFDELRQECRELAQQRDEASEQAASFKKRFEKVLEEARTARQEKNEMRMNMERLKMPPLPEESSPEYFQTENTRLKSELEKVTKLSESKMQDFEFVRQQYQQSSSAAAELAGENATQAAEILVLKNKIADGLGYKSAVLQAMSVQDALKVDAEKLSLRNNVLIEQLRRMRDEKMTNRGREGRRDIVMQDRKRASSASAEVGQRKKVDKVGQSRLSVASLMSPTPNDGFSQVPTSNPSASLQQMMRGQSHDSRAYARDRTPKRIRTPF